MDRREMLGYSIRRISKVLPGILGATTGLGSILSLTQKDELREEASCFPKARTDQPIREMPADEE